MMGDYFCILPPSLSVLGCSRNTLADIKHPGSRRELLGENLEAGCVHVGSRNGLSLDQKQKMYAVKSGESGWGMVGTDQQRKP